MIDYDKLLKEIPVFHRRPAPPVTRESLFKKAAAMARRGYVHNATTLEALEAYLQGYGVLLSGGMGIGKTFFFNVLNPEPLPVLSFNQCFLWKYEQLGEWLDDHFNREIVLDDIGWESGRASNYGTRFDTLQVVLDARLRVGRARTHITTNCTNDELVEKYDPHVVDRIYECCKCFVLPSAESKREAQVDYTYLRNAEYNRQNGKEEL
jgi:DNA replication protein DnaC